MNNEIIEKIRYTELLTKYVLEPSLTDIYVEGNDDKFFYDYHLSRLGKHFNFVDISTIEFDVSIDLQQQGLENNNRDKIIYLLTKINETCPDNHIYGIIDRDVLEYTRGFQNIPKNLFLTDFSCIEMYFFCNSNVKKVQSQTFHFVSVDDIQNLISFTAKFALVVIAEKRMQLSISKISSDRIHKYIDIKKRIVDLDGYICACLSNSNLSQYYEKIKTEMTVIEEELVTENPYLYVNGHNFISILRNFVSMHKEHQHIKQIELRNIYKASVEPDFLKNYELFKKLQTI